MPTPKKKRLDFAQNALRVVMEATGQIPKTPPPGEGGSARVIAGRAGGKKGGPARAVKLTKSERSAIAKNAAQKRWAKNKSTT